MMNIKKNKKEVTYEQLTFTAEELIKNTLNIYLKSFIEDFIKDCKGDTFTEDTLDFKKVISKIYEDGYDINGFGLDEIPIPEVYCFIHNEKNQKFDVYIYNNDVNIGYMCDGCEYNAVNINEAIKRYG